MPLKISLCDDEPHQISQMKTLLHEWSTNNNIEIKIHEYSSAEQFLFDYESNACDLLLLDIEMTGLNGMELAKSLRAKGDLLPIVFITGFSEYMSDGYDVEALHYLFKPVKKEKLFAVLNSKLSVAEQKHIRLSVKAQIPEGTPMTDVELCSVLGNLLDNAVKACKKLPVDDRFIRVYIHKFKGQFYLSVQNAAGEVKRKNGMFCSDKQGSHGFGLFRIDRIAKKYGGYVNRQYEEGVFATELMIPLEN